MKTERISERNRAMRHDSKVTVCGDSLAVMGIFRDREMLILNRTLNTVASSCILKAKDA